MSFATEKFVTEIEIRILNPLQTTTYTLEVDNLDISFDPIQETFAYLDYSREAINLGFFLNVSYSTRWIRAYSTSPSGASLTSLYIANHPIEFRIPELFSGWIRVYIDKDYDVSVNRSVVDRSHRINMSALDSFTTIPAWANKLRNTSVTKPPVTVEKT